MPLYEYRCEKCDEEFEVIKNINDEEEERCPKCDAPAKKLLSGFSVGSGSASGASLGSCSTGGGGFGGG